MKRLLRHNGLSIALLGLFLICEVALSIVGRQHHNQEQRQHEKPAIGYLEYLVSADFLEATMENWESEFLQMGAYVILTAFLYQKGSAESKKIDEPEAVDRDPRLSRGNPNAPWPVRKGGITLKIYANSLSLALFLLFALSFIWHGYAGAIRYSEEALAHGGVAVTTVQYLGTSQFWYESLQNWQSEFLSIGVMVILSIFLRQRGSPESKPVDASHHDTGHA